jgi:RND family efflux transporter MFP subunit
MSHIYNKKTMLPIVAVVLLLIIVAWMAGSFRDKVDPGVEKSVRVSDIETVAVINVSGQHVEPVPASIQAKQTTLISSRILARIDDIYVRSGDKVDKGQLLVDLEKRDLTSRVSQAEAKIQSVNALLKEAKQSLERTVELSQKGVLPTSDLDKARANYDTLLAERETAQQGMEEAKVALDFSSIVSPITGRVVDRFAEPGDTAQPGQKLLSIYNPLSLRVEANVREKLALSLELGQELEVEVPSLARRFKAEIEEIVPVSSPGSRSFLVKSHLHYTNGLLPGMFARLMVPSGMISRLLISEDRVRRVGQLEVVWVLKDGMIDKRFIRTGKPADDGLIEVLSGLSEGELIVNPQ